MFCENCGKPIPEGLSECPYCKPSTEPTAQEAETVAQEASAREVSTAETEPVVQTEAYAEPSFAGAPVKAKKGKKGLLFGGIAFAVAAVAMAVLVFLNFSFVEGLWIKTFRSEEDYFAFVEKKALAEYVDYSTSAYDTTLTSLATGSQAADTTVELNISDEAIALIEDALPEELESLDLNNYKNIRLALKYIITGDKYSVGANLGLGSNSLLDLNAIFDMAGKDAYVGIPNLSNKYLMFKDVLDESEMSGASSAYSEIDFEQIAEALPSNETLNAVLNKYVGIALDNLGNVTESNEKVEIGDYSEKLTVLKKKVTEKDLLKMATAVLKELKTDSEVKAIINDVEKFVFDEYADLLDDSDYEKGYFYDIFKKAITEALDEIDETDGSTEEIFTLVDYVNSSHEIVGRAITTGDEVLVSYLNVHKDDKFAFELECEQAELVITGEGVDKNGAITADYKVEVEETTVAEISLENFSTTDNKLNGSVTVKPSSDLVSLLSGESSVKSMISLLDPAVKVTFEATDASDKITFAVLSKDKEFVSLSIAAKTLTDKTVDIPSDAIDSEDVLAWADTLDVDKVVGVIKNLKLPSELTEMVDTYAAAIKNAGGIGSFVESMANLENSYGEDDYNDSYYEDNYDDSYYEDNYDDDYYGYY